MDTGPGLKLLFVGSAVLTAFLLLRAAHRSKRLVWILLCWLVLQAVLAMQGFFLETDRMPPRLLMAIGPPVLCILVLLSLRSGRAWLTKFDLRALTWLHLVRIPVEFGLHQLYGEGLIPRVMTFEGRNFDILSGISAPIVAIVAFRNGTVHGNLLLVWNILCLLLLLNIMFHGILSVPTPFQKFGFEQPNVALLYFPFEWLPALIVPSVLLAHIAAILQLVGDRRAISVGEPVN